MYPTEIFLITLSHLLVSENYKMIPVSAFYFPCITPEM